MTEETAGGHFKLPSNTLNAARLFQVTAHKACSTFTLSAIVATLCGLDRCPESLICAKIGYVVNPGYSFFENCYGQVTLVGLFFF